MPVKRASLSQQQSKVQRSFLQNTEAAQGDSSLDSILLHQKISLRHLTGYEQFPPGQICHRTKRACLTGLRGETMTAPVLALSTTQNPSNTLRPTTPKLVKHQTLTMTSMSRSTGRSDKARRAQGTTTTFRLHTAYAAQVKHGPHCYNIHSARQLVQNHFDNNISACNVLFCGKHLLVVNRDACVQSNMSWTCWKSWTVCMKSVLCYMMTQG